MITFKKVLSLLCFISFTTFGMHKMPQRLQGLLKMTPKTSRPCVFTNKYQNPRIELDHKKPFDKQELIQAGGGKLFFSIVITGGLLGPLGGLTLGPIIWFVSELSAKQPDPLALKMALKLDKFFTSTELKKIRKKLEEYKKNNKNDEK